MSTAQEALTIETFSRMFRNCRHGGPGVEDEQTEWYQASTQFAQAAILSLEGLTNSSSLSDIGQAVMLTIATIVQHPVFNRIRTSPKSARLFGALAVDAWVNNDRLSVKNLLLKATLIEFLQQLGPEAIIHHIQSGPRRSQFLEAMERILKERDIKRTLEVVTRRSCPCIQMSQVINEERDGSARVEREQRETEQLPPILKPNSKLWRTKKKAAACLKASQLQQSIDLYSKALEWILDAWRETMVTYRRDWQTSLVQESAKIESNLSFLALKRHEPEGALERANEAVTHFPTWSKGHSRRALALEALSRFEEAEAATCKALELCKKEMLEDPSKERERAEYLQIQQRIGAILDSRQVVNETEDQLTVQTLWIDLDQYDIGSLGGLLAAHGVFDTVLVFLTPTDVANLEQTCQGFAADPEPRRRLALSSPLWNLRSDEVDQNVRTYCYGRAPSASALRDLIASVFLLVPPSPELVLPSWLENMLLHASVASRNTIEMVCVRSGPECLQKALCYFVHSVVARHLYTPGIDPENLPGIYRYDHDGEILRLNSWLESFVDETGALERDFTHMWEGTFAGLNNLIIVASGRHRAAIRQIGESCPVLVHVVAFKSVVAKHIPSVWPCEQAFEQTWEYSAEDVASYWENSPSRVLRQWQSAFGHISQWIRETEKCGYPFILVNQRMVVESLPHCGGRVSVNADSFSIFLMKKCMEIGGANAVTKNLLCQQDYAEFIADYYSMVRLYNATFPKMVEWRHNRIAAARHHM